MKILILMVTTSLAICSAYAEGVYKLSSNDNGVRSDIVIVQAQLGKMICGQGGLNKDAILFCVSQNLNSVSISAINLKTEDKIFLATLSSTATVTNDNATFSVSPPDITTVAKDGIRYEVSSDK